MPTVLITGLSGYIALHVALRFLQGGYKVRGTVRSSSKGENILALPAFAPYVPNNMLETVVVPDLVEGDFTEAMKGVDAVCHLATPVVMSNDLQWKDFRDPAVLGTRNVHIAASKEESVKHVIQTSSFASMCDWFTPLDQQDGRVYTENDWFPITDDQAANLARDLPPDLQHLLGGLMYCASKKFSELEAMEVKRNSPRGYKLTILNPCTVLGPALDLVSLLSSRGFSEQTFIGLLKGRDQPVPPEALVNYVDVREVAEAHFQSIKMGAEGRLPLSAGNYVHQLIADRMRILFPSLIDRIPLGEPGKKGPKNILDASKSISELGIVYRPFDETIRDAVENVLEIERLQASME